MNRVERCDRAIRWGYHLLFAVVPLLFTPWNYELFEFNKMVAVYAITVVVTGAWLLKSAAKGKLEIARTPLDVPIAVFVSSQLVSSLFSIDPHVSWFGYYSRFNGGMFSIISYALLYYGFVSNRSALPAPSSLLKAALATGGIVAAYGVAERLGIDKHLWVQDVQNRVFSTLGQPNWLAAYVAALSPLVWALLQPAHHAKLATRHFVWIGTSVLFFVVLLFTRSRSGLLGFAVADAVFWGLVLLRSRRFVPAFFLVHLSFFLLIFFHGTSVDMIDRWFTLRSWQERGTPRPRVIEATSSATLLETGGTESGTIRKYVWQGALNAWRSSLKTLLIGTGTETFAFAFYQHRPKEHNLTSEWDFLYNKAHNEYLNYLATTGVFGLGSYLLLLGAAALWFINRLPKTPDLPFQAGLFAGWLSILMTNFFGFSVVVTQLFLFLFPAMGAEQQGTYRVSIAHALFAPFVLLVSLGLLVVLSVSWYADTLYATGYRQNRAGQYADAVVSLGRAVQLLPVEPLFADELASAYAGRAVQVVEEKDATEAARLIAASLAASDRAIATSPRNVAFWKTRTKVFYAFSQIDAAFTAAAIEALQRAQTLSPHDPKITYNLAILYGRIGENEKAIDVLQRTVALKPNYRDAYYALWVFYTEMKRPERAREVLQEYLRTVDPGDADFRERLSQ